MRFRFALRACLIAFALAGCPAAHAQLFRAYLSVMGSDANACTLVAPCRLLPAALAAVADGGEIWMLNSANYNTGTVSVTKSVSILAIPGALGSLVATGGGSALHVASPMLTVALRNLVIRASGASQHGIDIDQPAVLQVDGCEIVGMAMSGINVTGGAFVTVRNTTSRDSQGAGVQVSNGAVSLEDVRLVSNVQGVRANGPSRVTITDSVMAGNSSYGILVFGTTPDTTRVVVDNSVITGSFSGIDVSTNVVGAALDVTLGRSHLTHHFTAVGVSGEVTVIADGNVITENGIGFNFDGGTIYTRGNNTLRFNTVGDVMGGSLTPASGN